MILAELAVDMAAWKAWVVLGLLGFMVAMFATEKMRVDVVALVGLATLLVLGILTPEESFAGFGSPVLIMLASVFVIGGALQETGVLDLVGHRLTSILPRGETWMILGLMAITAALSAFLNNTSVTAMLVPVVVAVARRTQLNASRLLMPMAFASILGGTCTLIGTSTNVAVSGYMAKAGMEPVGLFEITPVGILLVGTGIVFMLVIGRYLLPTHRDDRLAEDLGKEGFLSEIVLQPGSPIAGRMIQDSDLAKMEFRILRILRGTKNVAPRPDTLLEEGDVLLVTGNVANLIKVKATEGIEIRADLKLGAADLKQPGVELAEIVVSPSSNLVGRTLKEVRFQQEFGLAVLALHRLGQNLRDKISRIRLRPGDLLLVQGRSEAIDDIRRGRDFAVLIDRGVANPALRKPATAVGIFIVALILGGFDLVSLPSAFFLAAVTMVLTGCLRAARLYDSIEWRLLILIGSMMAFGRAMEVTGSADLLARGVVSTVGNLGPLATLGGFCLLTVLLSQPMSNAAAALVVLPVALRTAAQLDIDPRTAAMGVMLAASVSVATPLEPSCVLVYGPGKYRFADFLKVGFPLTLVLLAVLIWQLPQQWPLKQAAPVGALTNAPAALPGNGVKH